MATKASDPNRFDEIGYKFTETKNVLRPQDLAAEYREAVKNDYRLHKRRKKTSI